ncbi:Uncharacterised protein [Mycobacterium tuberculosis]|nr:Uncharacterised protein [Mycobacterium tuberculosis]COW65743.1 Uncharacterised protein [Mycobacterium tuberculosis]
MAQLTGRDGQRIWTDKNKRHGSSPDRRPNPEAYDRFCRGYFP